MGKDSCSGKEDWEGDWKEVKVEDHLDSNGWPKVKAFYVDRSPYPCKGDNALRYDSIIEFLIEQEKNIALEKGYEEPRMVFLLQDKDYWPGTETDPEAQKRQELKQSQAHVFPGHKDMIIHWHRNYGGIKEILQMRSDPSLPGSSFIQEHLNCSLPCCLESEDDPDISGSCGSSSRKRKSEEEEKEEEAREEEEKHQSNRNAEGEGEKNIHEQEKKKRTEVMATHMTSLGTTCIHEQEKRTEVTAIHI